MSQKYKVGIYFVIDLSASTDETAEKLAKRALRDALDHAENTDATYIKQRTPEQQSEFSISTNYVVSE